MIRKNKRCINCNCFIDKDDLNLCGYCETCYDKKQLKNES